MAYLMVSSSVAIDATVPRTPDALGTASLDGEALRDLCILQHAWVERAHFLEGWKVSFPSVLEANGNPMEGRFCAEGIQTCMCKLQNRCVTRINYCI